MSKGTFTLKLLLSSLASSVPNACEKTNLNTYRIISNARGACFTLRRICFLFLLMGVCNWNVVILAGKARSFSLKCSASHCGDELKYSHNMIASVMVSVFCFFTARRCTKAYKYLRDKYARERKLISRGEKKESSWEFYDDIKFLDPFIKARNCPRLFTSL